LLNAQQAAVIN